MRRRTYLALVGGLLGAGCSGLSSPSTPTLTPAPVTTRTDGPTATPTPADPAAGPESTVELVRIGRRDEVRNPADNRPHVVEIWNTADTGTRIAVTISSRPSGSDVVQTVLDETYEVPPDAAVQVRLVEPSNYVVEVRVSAIDAGEQFTVPADSFDCNEHGYQVAVVPADERIEVTEYSTAVACVELTPTGDPTETG